MIRIEFPSDNKRLAGLLGAALWQYANGLDLRSAGESYDGSDAAPNQLAGKEEEASLNNARITAACEGIAKFQDVLEKVKAIDPAKTETAPEAIAESADEVDVSAARVDGGSLSLDRHGVAFNPDFCANAADPFYNTGPREGQWKKRRGLDDAAYDAWYSSQRTPTAPVATEFDAGAAFGAPAAEQVATDAPTDGAGFMVWVSEMLAAGRLKQADINDAWQALRLTPQDIFPPKGPEDVQRNVANLYNALAGA